MSNGKILNPEQKKAIGHTQGPLLIIAGAGTGKTTVITQRIQHLIVNKNVLPSEILALTFTEKAASEMQDRIDIVLPYGLSDLWIATFHAFCDRILRNEAINIGLSPSYTLVTETEAILFLRKNLFRFQLDYFRPLGNPYKFLSSMLQHFSRLKDEDISPIQYLAWAKKETSEDKDEIKKNLELAHTYQTYEELKEKEGIMDFSDLIAFTLKLFRTRSSILKAYQNQFKYILVDEFQDTNFAQNQLAILLAGHSTLRDEPSGSDSKRKKQNITVVGDDDQAIYRWRGAAISNIIQFKKHFKETKIIALTKNYRSTKEILDVSYNLIQNNNPDRLEAKEKISKKLTSERGIKGEDVEFFSANRAEDEAVHVAKTIKELTTKDQRPKTYRYKDIAILVRANDHAQVFVRSFERANIPYQFLGPGQLFHQEEIKDLIAYLRVLANFEDTASLYRIMHMPIFHLPPLAIAMLLNFAKKKNITLFETLKQTEQVFLSKDAKETCKKIAAMIERHIGRITKDTAGQLLYYFLQDTGILQNLMDAKTERQEQIAKNIAKLFEKLKTYEAGHGDASVFAVVDWIDLAMQMGESPLAADVDFTENNAVNILTIHASKGLEFGCVFLVNLVEQRFPTRERKESIPVPKKLVKEILPTGDFHMQEERRLFYVGMTRAQDRLFLTAAKYYGDSKRIRKLSPFVYEALGKKRVQDALQKQEVKENIYQLSLLEWAKPIESNKTQVTSDKKQGVPITYLSYSQIQTFEICPLHYKLRYILKIPTPQSSAQSFGTSIHAALRDYYKLWLAGENPSVDRVGKILINAWINEGYTSRSHEEEAKRQAEKIITSYLEKNFSKSNLPLALELSFMFFLENPKNKNIGLKLGGRIDRIDKLKDGKIEIFDYKTGKNMPTEKDLLTNEQLTFYALAATEVKDPNLSKKPEDVVLSLYYLETDQKLSTTRTKEQLEIAKLWIINKAKEISESDFACSKSMLCTNCEYKMLCQIH